MKLLYLILNRIKRYVVKNKTIFILFTIGSILTSTFFAYFYGNTEFMQEFNDKSLSGRDYTVYLDEPISYDLPELNALYESDLIDTVFVVNRAYRDDLFDLKACTKGKLDHAYVAGRTEFKEGERYSIIVDHLSKHRTGSTVTINGTELNVIGASVNSHIPPETFDELGLEIHCLEIYPTEVYRLGQDAAFIDFIASTLGSYHRNTESPITASSSDIFFEIILLCACFSLAVISFMFLIKYMLDSIMDETAVSLIVGASKIRIFLISFFEIMLFSLVNSAIGILLHKLLYNSFFSKINKIQTTVYLASDYLYIYLIFNLLCAIVSVFLLMRYAMLTPREARRRSI